jgi:hypothetical protein
LAMVGRRVFIAGVLRNSPEAMNPLAATSTISYSGKCDARNEPQRQECG